MTTAEREIAFKEWMLRHHKRGGHGNFKESSVRGYASHLRNWRKHIRNEKIEAIASYPDNLFDLEESLRVGEFIATIRALADFSEYIGKNHHNLDNALSLYEEFLTECRMRGNDHV